MGENNTELIIYQTEEGKTKIDVHMENETVWLSLDQMAELFQRDKSTISKHIKNIFVEGELTREAVVANFATTATDGKTYQVDHYNLDVIISVGYRVKSLRGTQFRIARLDDYLRMTDSEVLQNAGSVSHALAEQKAKEEYQKYKRIHCGDLTPVEQAFLESVEATAKRLEGK